MKVAVEKYNPNWTTQFKMEEQLLIEQLSEVEINIEHIGSTAIEGLCAKPIIDIMIGLRKFELADKLIDRIEGLGYVYIDKYNDVMPQRRFFQKSNGGQRTHHIHMVEIGTYFWKRHLSFRNHLRSSKTDRDNYGKLKQELAERDWNDSNEYASAKTSFIRGIERKTATNKTKAN